MRRRLRTVRRGGLTIPLSFPGDPNEKGARPAASLADRTQDHEEMARWQKLTVAAALDVPLRPTCRQSRPAGHTRERRGSHVGAKRSRGRIGQGRSHRLGKPRSSRRSRGVPIARHARWIRALRPCHGAPQGPAAARSWLDRGGRLRATRDDQVVPARRHLPGVPTRVCLLRSAGVGPGSRGAAVTRRKRLPPQPGGGLRAVQRIQGNEGCPLVG